MFTKQLQPLKKKKKKTPQNIIIVGSWHFIQALKCKHPKCSRLILFVSHTEQSNLNKPSIIPVILMCSSLQRENAFTSARLREEIKIISQIFSKIIIVAEYVVIYFSSFFFHLVEDAMQQYQTSRDIRKHGATSNNLTKTRRDMDL